MNILLTGFSHSSAQKLVDSCDSFDTLILPNDKPTDAMLLKTKLLQKEYNYVICIGQKPNMKNRISIEKIARNAGMELETTVNCDGLVHLFFKHGIAAKISNDAGTSYCNSIYWNGLQFIRDVNMETKIVFIHIPFEKNIDDFVLFRESFLETLEELK